ncbi:MAG: efflux RND transporter periplasmic adaptor subunit [bacterium]
MKKILIILAIILAIGAVVFFATRSKTTVATDNVTYEKVSKGDINLTVSGTGSVVSKTTQNVVSKVQSKVTEVDVKVGDKVTKGQVIAKFDDFDLQQAEKSAEYNYNAAYYRREQLKSAPVKDDNAIKQAQQQLNAASVSVDSAKNSLNNAIITSPIDGTIITLNVKVNDFGSLTAPVAIVQDLSSLEAQLNVNEIDINKVKVGQSVDLTIDAIDGVRKDKITKIEDNGLNVNGVINYIVRADIEKIDGLKTAMTINADIAVQDKLNVLRIPAVSVKIANNVSTVQVVKTGSSLTKLTSNDIETKTIETGLNNNSYIEVISGLSEGDLVVTSVTKASGGLFGLSGNSGN